MPEMKKARHQAAPEPSVPESAFRGSIDELSDNRIKGWFKEDNSEAPLRISVLVNGSEIVSDIEASEFRADLEASGIGNGCYAFDVIGLSWSTEIPLHEQLEIEVLRSNDNALIFRQAGLGSEIPYVINNAAAMTRAAQNPTPDLSDLTRSPLYRGEVLSFSDGIITGWALSVENPLRPVTLKLWLAGVDVAVVTTGTEQPKVSRAIGLPTKAGFSFDLSSVSEKCARGALGALRTMKRTDLELEHLIKVRIGDMEESLPISKEIQGVTIPIGDISKKLLHVTGAGFLSQRTIFVDEILSSFPLASGDNDQDVRVIAYYLPQFHPFPENEEWWGPGFTEWTNVSAAKSFYKDHYQPHLPSDFGFYDLRIEQVQRAQIELAKRYGVSGFCYYYYWFSGRTLMTLPIDRHVEQDMDMDFCLCWANESWSRRWDGSETDVLIAQRHTYDSDVEFIRYCLPYFRSSRYIRVNGAPLLQIYRISLMERPRETVERWREIVRAEGFPDLHVCMVESFGLSDPFEYGCDSSCQFPPHGVVGDRINAQIDELDPNFTGTIYSYDEIVRGEIARPNPVHTRFRAAMPSWDNTARKGPAGNIFAGASPAMFETWMRFLVGDTRRRLPAGQRLIFVNAWNEWAEGTHLEPDRRFGHANLRAIRNALASEALAMAPLRPPSDGTDDHLAETRRYVASLINSNRALMRLASPTTFGQREVEESQFAKTSLQLLDPKPTNSARYNIETVNGKFVTREMPISLATSQGLGLKGWVVCAEVPSAKLMVGLRSTTLTRDVRRYVASIHYRDPRQDVVEALGLDGSVLHNGFVLRASLLPILPGRYEIELIFPDSVGANSGRVVQTGFFILIG